MTLLSDIFNVVSFRNVIKAWLSIWVIRFLDISSRDRFVSIFKAFTGTSDSSLSCKFKFFK